MRFFLWRIDTFWGAVEGNRMKNNSLDAENVEKPSWKSKIIKIKMKCWVSVKKVGANRVLEAENFLFFITL